MITQYVITLKAIQGHPLYSDSAYRLYAYLLEKLPVADGQWLHEEGARSISQFLCYDKEEKTYRWTVNILTDEAAEILVPVMDSLLEVTVESQTFPVLDKTIRKITAELMLNRAQDEIGNKRTLSFLTAASFKQNGRYVIFPQERLILQSLIMRWNEVFPQYVLEDEDAFQAILAGIHIVDYQLRTSRFHLKGIRIPGFIGSCIVEARLALPLMELWNTLLLFADYSGIGIKTGLGMGGLQVEKMKNTTTG